MPGQITKILVFCNTFKELIYRYNSSLLIQNQIAWLYYLSLKFFFLTSDTEVYNELDVGVCVFVCMVVLV